MPSPLYNQTCNNDEDTEHNFYIFIPTLEAAKFGSKHWQPTYNLPATYYWPEVEVFHCKHFEPLVNLSWRLVQIAWSPTMCFAHMGNPIQRSRLIMLMLIIIIIIARFYSLTIVALLLLRSDSNSYSLLVGSVCGNTLKYRP